MVVWVVMAVLVAMLIVVMVMFVTVGMALLVLVMMTMMMQLNIGRHWLDYIIVMRKHQNPSLKKIKDVLDVSFKVTPHTYQK